MSSSFKVLISVVLLSGALVANAASPQAKVNPNPVESVQALPPVPVITEELLGTLDKDPESIGRMMSMYVGSLPVLMAACNWESERSDALTVKVTRVIEIYYGAMSATEQVAFARGYFGMEEEFIQALNQTSEAQLAPYCSRINKDEGQMHEALSVRLEPLEKLVLKGVLHPMNPYEGRGTFTLPSTSSALKNQLTK